jgi:maleate isomerase
MITPSSNTCLEPVTYRLLAGRRDVTAHFARVGVTRIALDAHADNQFSSTAMSTAARQLGDAKVDAVVWNGTAGSWLGVDHDRTLVETLGDAGGAPATTSTLALLDACRAYGVTRLGLATPYTGDVNERVGKVFAAEGIEITADSALGLSDNEAFAAVPVDRVAAQLRSVAGGADAVAVLCTNVHGAELAEPLEAELGVPVLDSVAVTLWNALTIVGSTSPITGFGTLLRDGHLRRRLQGTCDALRAATGSDRTTIRLDLPVHGLHVGLPVAESLGPAVRAIRRDGAIDQRALPTVQWLESHRSNLVQPHFRDEPKPPRALTDGYGVRAQMLGPVEREGAMAGWLSVHSLTERDWTPGDAMALDTAREEVAALLDTIDES